MLGVPLLREGTIVGVFVLTRCRVKPFTNKEIELVTTFADQAVTQAEIGRLCDRATPRTEPPWGPLGHRPPPADVLKAISRSAFDLETILNALIEAAARLCEADQGTIARQQGSSFARVASWGF